METIDEKEQWEYMSHIVASDSRTEDKDKLRSLGREGWEAYCVTERQFGPGLYAKYHLKRRVHK